MQLSIPADDRVGSHEAAKLIQDAATQRATLGREAASLGVREAKLLTAELFEQYPVLLFEVLDRVELVAVDPTGKHQHQEPKGFGRHGRTIGGSIVLWHHTSSRTTC